MLLKEHAPESCTLRTPECPGPHAKLCFTLQVIHALGQAWHPEHFVCAHCKAEIGSSPFFERSGLAYCAEDYHHLFSPRCAYCAAPILDVSEPAAPAFAQFLLEPGSCFTALQPPNHSPLLFQKVLTAMNQTWHPEHFFCAHCGEVFGEEGTARLVSRAFP